MSHNFAFAGADLRLLPGRALFWPAQSALLVADLHLEKASWFGRAGQFLPPYDSADTLARLAVLVAETGARNIWCLGDSFHDAGGPDRLAAADRTALHAIADRAEFHWITGNHDLHSPLHGIPGDRVAEADVAGIMLRHEAELADTRPEISGHFHPKLRLALHGRNTSRPCALLNARRLIMPAFGAYTGGLFANDRALTGIMGGDAIAMVATERGIIRRAPNGKPPQSAAMAGARL